MVATVTYSLETTRSTFQVNTWTFGPTKLAPDVLGLSNGGYVVAYNNGNINNGYILLDFYDAAGNNLNGGWVGAYTNDAGGSFNSTDAIGAPSLTQLDDGNIVVVWADLSVTGSGIRGSVFS